MEHRISYAAIGAFVIVLGGCLAAGLIWLAAGGSGASYDTYAMYLKSGAESLNRDSPVLYHGVSVGHVISVSLDPEHPERAKVLLGVRENIVLKSDTEATVETRGLTGAGYVELSGGAPNQPVLRAESGQEYPVIPAKPGTLESLTGAVSHVAGRIVELSNRLDAILSDKNIASITVSLANIRKLTSSLAAQTTHLSSAITNLDATMANARAASSEFPALMEQLHTTIAKYNGVAGKIGSAVNNVGRASQRLGALAPEADSLLSQLASVSRNLNALVQQLARQPNSVLFGRPVHPGPGESGPSGD